MWDALFEYITNRFTGAFQSYGELVGRHPLPFIILPIIVFGAMGSGLMLLKTETDIEEVYFPKNSRAIGDRQFIRDTFPYVNNVSYNVISQSDEDDAVSFIFKTKDRHSIFDPLIAEEILSYVDSVKRISKSGKSFDDFCAVSKGHCMVDGEFALRTEFLRGVALKVITYPKWNSAMLDNFIEGAHVDKKGKLISASVLMVSFRLAKDAPDWKKEVLEYAGSVKTVYVDVAYETPESLSEALDKSTKGDIVFFSLTISLCCSYASIVSNGGNPVSSRSMLAFGGILAAGLGILGSMGLLSALGVEYVNIVGVIPFLVIGICLDDMFLLMSSWSQHLPSHRSEQNVEHVPIILGRTIASAGISVTITSVTDFLAFVIGITSSYRSVSIFCLYAGVAVFFCYLANVTLFAGCLALHGRRVYSSRHHMTCRVTKPRKQLRKEGRSTLYVNFCGGSPPTKERGDESACERFPSQILPIMFKNKPVSVIIMFLFGGYLAVAIYGAISIEQGLVLQHMVLTTSYYFKYHELSSEYFLSRRPIGIYVKGKVDYLGKDGQLFQNLLQQVQRDGGIIPDMEKCWLTAYRSTPLFNSSTSNNFVSNLQMFFKHWPNFRADVVTDRSNTHVIASRCFVYSNVSKDHYFNVRLMSRLRSLADDSPLTVFAYHWSFVDYEHVLGVVPATLQLVGCAVAVMTVVTFLFLPHPLMVLLVVLTIVMIQAGIFGFMHFWGLTLSSITMIHLVISVGFSVEFSTHVCAAYLLSPAARREERARDAIRDAAGPILNGATSSLLGVLLLVASSSYIFQSFFKVMFLVIILGLLHAVFFLPAVLSLCGPQKPERQSGPEAVPVDLPPLQPQTHESRAGSLQELSISGGDTVLSAAQSRSEVSSIISEDPSIISDD